MKIGMLAVDLAKGSFRFCGVGADGAVLFNRAMSQRRFLQYLTERRACILAMEACFTSHHRGQVAQVYCDRSGTS